jgi:hypothetical protein
LEITGLKNNAESLFYGAIGDFNGDKDFCDHLPTTPVKVPTDAWVKENLAR